MEAVYFALAIAAVFLGVGALVGWAFYAAYQRQKKLRAIAAHLGWAFAERADHRLAEFHPYPLFQQGRSPLITGYLQGTFGGIPVEVFDFSYTVGYGKNRQTPSQTVVHFTTGGLALPAFTLRPENVFHKIGSAFGYQDLDFEHRPEFSRRYCLRGPAEPSVRAAFPDEILDHFEANPGLSVDAGGEHLFVFRDRRLVKPEGLQDFLEQAVATLRAFERARLRPLGEVPDAFPPPLPALQ